MTNEEIKKAAEALKKIGASMKTLAEELNKIQSGFEKHKNASLVWKLGTMNSSINAIATDINKEANKLQQDTIQK